MASSRITLGAIFNVVTKAANTLTNSVAVVDEVIGAVNTSAKNMVERHSIDSDLDMVNYEGHAIARVTQEAVEAAERIDEWKAAKPSRAKSWNKHQSALLDAVKLRREARNGKTK